MVRIIMGSALAVCKGIRDKDYIIKKIKNPNSLDEKLVASPKGLYLNEIVYK
jgi:tRNA U38,U39,U40 pseudouridine synthase TruA